MKLEVKNLRFDSASGETILENASFELLEGDIIILEGITVGKTLIIRLLLGLVDSTSGDIFYDGKAIRKMGRMELKELRKNIGYLPQKSGLLPNLTVFENLALPLEYHTRLSMSVISDNVLNYLNKTNLAYYKDYRPHLVSNSKKRIIDLLRALILEPKIVLIDDPIEDISDEDFTVFEDLITEKNKENVSFFITTDPSARFARFLKSKHYTLNNKRLNLLGDEVTYEY